MRILVLLLSTLPLFLFSQENGYYLVELEPRSPDVEAVIGAFEGTKAIAVMANDIDGKSINISDYKGKSVLLWFWHLKCDRCIQEIATLNTLASEFPDLRIVSFAHENSETLKTFEETHPMDFSVIPNSEILAEGPYSGELGFPKMFIVDQTGTIKWVFPSKDFLSPKFDLYKIVKTLYMQLNQ